MKISTTTTPFLKSVIAATAVTTLILTISAPSTAAADAKLAALIGPIMSAHRAVKSLSCTISLNRQQGTEQEANTLNFSFRKPDFAKVAVSGLGGQVMRGVSNGKKLMLYSVEDKRYVTKDLPVGNQGAPALATASQSMILKVFMRPEGLSEILSDPQAGAHFTGTSTVAGTPVDMVDAALDSTPGHSVKISLGFSRADHLLRSLNITMIASRQGVTRQMRIDEVVKSLSLSPHLAERDFDVSPPHGASLLTEAEAQPGLYDPRLKPGALPFSITAKDLTGKPVSLAQYRGKVLLVDFWATWCGPCVAEIPNVLAVYKQYHGQGLEVVGFSQDQDEGTLRSFLAQRGIPWRQVFCGAPGGDRVPVEYGIQGIPFMVLIGRDGKIAGVDLRGPALGEAVQAAVGK